MELIWPITSSKNYFNPEKKILKSAKKLLAIGCFCIGTNQVDLDFCEGKIEGSLFQASLSDEAFNGDGLDLSGSKVVIINNSFNVKSFKNQFQTR